MQFTRNIANIVTDLNDVERVALRALGGNDNVTIGDMTGTDLSVADVDLGAFTGGGDAAQDTVTVNGTDRPDNVKVNRAEDQVVTTGLRTQTRIANSECSTTRCASTRSRGTTGSRSTRTPSC